MLKDIVFLLFFVLISTAAFGQTERDTLSLEIQPEMIHKAKVQKIDYEEGRAEYRISVRLKKSHHEKFERLTGENIGNFLAIEFEGEVISTRGLCRTP